jgi:hypothetical protein
MPIRSETIGVVGVAALRAEILTIPAVSPATLPIGGLLLLICP